MEQWVFYNYGRQFFQKLSNTSSWETPTSSRYHYPITTTTYPKPTLKDSVSARPAAVGTASNSQPCMHLGVVFQIDRNSRGGVLYCRGRTDRSRSPSCSRCIVLLREISFLMGDGACRAEELTTDSDGVVISLFIELWVSRVFYVHMVYESILYFVIFYLFFFGL